MDGRSMDRSMDGSNRRPGRPTGRPALSARSRIRIVPPLSVSQSAIRARGREPPRGDQSAALHPFSSHPVSQAPACRPARRRLPAGRAPRRIALCDESSSSRGRSPSLSFGWRFASLRRGARLLLLVMCAHAYTTRLARVSRSPSLPVARGGRGHRRPAADGCRRRRPRPHAAREACGGVAARRGRRRGCGAAPSSQGGGGHSRKQQQFHLCFGSRPSGGRQRTRRCAQRR